MARRPPTITPNRFPQAYERSLRGARLKEAGANADDPSLNSNKLKARDPICPRFSLCHSEGPKAARNVNQMKRL
jgi:hypothetical protein